MIAHIQRMIFGLVTASIGMIGVPAHAQTSGRPVASMTIFDTKMQDFMSSNNIGSAVLGIMRNGNVVYLRGFGTLDTGINMPENAMVRLASCTKPLTAAATRRMIATNVFGSQGEDRKAFNLSNNNGLLPYTPFPSLGDSRLKDVTVQHLLMHRGGWDRDVAGDHTYRELEIAADMSVASPPGRVNTQRWILGRTLIHTPGATYKYSNEGYLTLGLIVSTNAAGGFISYIRSDVFPPDSWIPSTEIEQSHTFRSDRNLREPWYISNQIVPSVFDSNPGMVFRPYGGVDMEARLGQGGVIASAPAMLQLANRYHIAPGSAEIGMPIDVNNPLTSNEGHNGGQSGVNTYLLHRTDGVVVFVFFNRNKNEYGSGHYGNDFISIINPILDAGTQFTWPNTTSDGFWVTPGAEIDTGYGGYHSTYRGINNMLNKCASGSKVRLKPGSATWTGTMNKRLLIDAPEGIVTIGQ